MPPSPHRTRPPRGGPPWLWIAAGGLAVAVLLFWLASAFPGALSGGTERAWAVHHVILLAVLGAALLVRMRGRPGTMLRQAAIWIAIGALIVLGYSFREDVTAAKDRVMAELFPSQGRVAASGEAVVFRRSQGGHFVVDGRVDGVPVRFLVDTGASDVVLSRDDAARLGFDVDGLDYSRTYWTANGAVKAAPVRLDRLEVGPVVLDDVRATVNGAPLDISLLGLSFLDRLANYRIEGDRLTLVP